MNNVEKEVIDSLCDITGLDYDSVIEAKDLNLFKSKILDSLSFVNLMNEIEERLDIEIDFTSFNAEEITSFASILELVNKIYNSNY